MLKYIGTSTDTFTRIGKKNVSDFTVKPGDVIGHLSDEDEHMLLGSGKFIKIKKEKNKEEK